MKNRTSRGAVLFLTAVMRERPLLVQRFERRPQYRVSGARLFFKGRHIFRVHQVEDSPSHIGAIGMLAQLGRRGLLLNIRSCFE